MRRWGQISAGKPDAWYHETAKKVYQPDIYERAARELLDEGKIEKADVPWDSDGYKPPTADFIDGIEYDGKRPLEYLSKHEIGNKDPVG
jgi:nitrate/nitrite transport system substrate-binding protein